MYNQNQQTSFQGNQQTPTSEKQNEIQSQQQQFTPNSSNFNKQGYISNQNTLNTPQQNQSIPSNSQIQITPNQQIPKFPQNQVNQQNVPNPQIQLIVNAPQIQNNQSNTSNQQSQQSIQIKSYGIQIQNQIPSNIQSLQALNFNSSQNTQNNEIKVKNEKQINQFDQNISSLIQQKQKSYIQVQNIKKEIVEEEKVRENLSKQLQDQSKNLDSQIQELQNQFDQIQVERNELQIQLGMENQRISQLTSTYRESKRNTEENTQLLPKIEQLEKQNQNLKSQIELQQEIQFNNSNKQHEMKRLSEIIQTKNKQLAQIKQEQITLNEDIIQLESQLQLRDQNINKITFDLKQEERQLKKLLEQVDSMKEEIKINDDRIRLKNEQISQLEQATLAAFRNSGQVIQVGSLKKDIEYKTLEYDREIKRKQGDLTQSKLIMMKNKKDQKQAEESQRLLKIKQGKELQMKFKESFGQLEVCFLIDSTASMEPYKNQAQLCVKGSVKAIRDLTQRDTNWSTVCYVDTDILSRLGGMYKQYGFTKDSDELENFIQSVNCTANRDRPEDVEGGMKQMLNNLPWQTKFKLVILICDCPCHGTKYHDYGRNGDYQPDSDITSTIEKIIQEDIFFIGIIFTSETIKMYGEIRKIFERHNKEEYFILSDLRNVPQDQQFKHLTEILSFASQQATQTNVKSTRTHNQTNVIKQTNNLRSVTQLGMDPKQFKNSKENSEIDSSVEALCKLNLEQGLNADNAVRETFKVFRVQMKEESFQNKMKMIQNIGYDDFQMIEENDWDCLRSKNAFAKGAMKAAFLMTKSKFMNQKNEFYVCKTPLNMQPYPNKESALKECILHLMSQKWLRKFYKDLDEVTASTKKQFPQISYSDLLLLQDSNKKFWLAERFFEGNFVKYNNNWGYVNTSTDDINKIAQCFTYYTYFKSDYQYMICDIQGVGICLTDPAVCTKNNLKIDNTDTGEEGIGRYIVSFGAVKNICTNILNALKIEL